MKGSNSMNKRTNFQHKPLACIDVRKRLTERERLTRMGMGSSQEKKAATFPSFCYLLKRSKRLSALVYNRHNWKPYQQRKPNTSLQIKNKRFQGTPYTHPQTPTLSLCNTFVWGESGTRRERRERF